VTHVYLGAAMLIAAALIIIGLVIDGIGLAAAIYVFAATAALYGLIIGDTYFLWGD
jgi:hypothetical protein